MQAFLDQLISNVLNNTTTLMDAYRKMNVPLLLSAFGDCKHNILAVG